MLGVRAASLFVALILLFLCAGCRPETGLPDDRSTSETQQASEPEDTTEAPKPIIGKDLPSYTIVVSKTAADTVRSAAAYLGSEIERLTGIKLEVADDGTAPSNREIIVGKTNREESAKFGCLGATEYAISASEDAEKIVLTGGSSVSTFIAVGLFLTRYSFVTDKSLMMSDNLPGVGDYTDPDTYQDMPEDHEIGYPRTCAHRGCNDFAPENTLPAFALAVALGAEEIELDIRVSADGEYIIIHDDSVEKTSNGKGLISQMRLSTIKGLDAGSWFSEELKGLKYSTFAEILEVFAGKVIINIHVKSSGTDAIDPSVLRGILDTIDRYNCRGQVYIAARNDIIEALQGMNEDITLCLLAGVFSTSLDQINYAIEHKIPKVQLAKTDISGELLRLGKEAGIIYTYATIDSQRNAQSLLNMGVDVILTNRFTLIKPVVKSAGWI